MISVPPLTFAVALSRPSRELQISCSADVSVIYVILDGVLTCAAISRFFVAIYLRKFQEWRKGWDVNLRVPFFYGLFYGRANSAAKSCNPTQHTANAESPNTWRKQRCAKQ